MENQEELFPKRDELIKEAHKNIHDGYVGMNDAVSLPEGQTDKLEPFESAPPKDRVRILAIDQASNCGWASKNASGVWDFNTRKDESSGMKMLRFRAKLQEVCALENINLIVYERVAGFHKAAIIHAAKMVAIIESFCEENDIAYKAVSATEVKKYATGKGNANKDKMVEAAQLKLGYTGKDDNEADALWIYQLVKQELGM